MDELFILIGAFLIAIFQKVVLQRKEKLSKLIDSAYEKYYPLSGGIGCLVLILVALAVLLIANTE